MKIAKCSNGTVYQCLQQWPDDSFVQCGAAGIVLRKDGSYKTAFFEAFPRVSDTLSNLTTNSTKKDGETFFLRGEGKNIEEAEKSAFDKFIKIKNCASTDEGHSFEKIRFSDGKCKHCNFIKPYVFEPDTICTVCSKKAVFSAIGDDYYCFEHYTKTINELSDKDLFIASKSNSEKSILEELLSAGIEEDEEEQDTISYYRTSSIMVETLIKHNIIELNKKEIDSYPIFNKLSNDFTWFFVNFINKFIKENFIISSDTNFSDYITIKDKINKKIDNSSNIYVLIIEKFLLEKGVVTHEVNEMNEMNLNHELNVLIDNMDLK